MVDVSSASIVELESIVGVGSESTVVSSGSEEVVSSASASAKYNDVVR